MSTRANKAMIRLLERLWHTLPCRRDIVLGAPVLLLILTACQPGASQAPSISQTTTTAPAARSACEVRNFEATVLQGKNAGLTLQGTLILQADAAGRLMTRLTPKTGNATRGSGQVNGRAINLFFDLGAGKNIFGTGTLDHDFAECKGVLGGTFAGPDRADTGTWGCSCCPCYIRTISPTLGLAPLRPFRAARAAEQLRAGEFAVIKGNLVPAPRVPAP
jgi:hypothetical protein